MTSVNINSNTKGSLFYAETFKASMPHFAM